MLKLQGTKDKQPPGKDEKNITYGTQLENLTFEEQFTKLILLKAGDLHSFVALVRYHLVSFPNKINYRKTETYRKKKNIHKL